MSSNVINQICSQTQGDECARTLLAASELRSQKGSPKKSSHKTIPLVYVPTSLESCSITLSSIAEASISSVESGCSASSVFDAHEAEVTGWQDDEAEGDMGPVRTFSKMKMASPHSSFKMDASLCSSDHSCQLNTRILPFRFAC
jgi:hypothetical protein